MKNVKLKIVLLLIITLKPLLLTATEYDYSQKVTPDSPSLLEFEGVKLKIPAGSVEKDVVIGITRQDSTHKMGNTMENATSGAASYRFTPAGTKFKKNIEVILPFDESLLESETALSNLFSYFYDRESSRWERLPRLEIDREKCVVVSLTNHFTDMINATLKMPESPEPLDFNINSIKNLEVMNPSAGVSQLKGLTPNSTGAATFQIPLNIPPGRGMATPNLALSYNSESPNSWMGRGFDISVPSISTDTAFGLPKYDDSDTYMYEGEELKLITSNGNTKIYRPRVEKSFKQITRLQGNGYNYWEITDKSGNVEIYGQSNGWIGPDRGNRSKTFIWYLTKRRDVNGNTVIYNYDYDSANNHVYLKEIVYSGWESSIISQAGNYKITFATSSTRPDRRMNSRGKFMSKLVRRLDKIDIAYNNQTFRSYKFEYQENLFSHTLLNKVTELDGSGAEFYSYSFDFEDLSKVVDGGGNTIGYNGFGERTVDWNAVSGNTFPGFNRTQTTGIGASLHFGASLDVLTYKGWFTWGYDRVLGIGVSGGIDSSGTVTKSTLMDVNGDGLPDAVWKNGSTLMAYKNTGSGFDTNNRITMPGISGSFNEIKQDGFNVGLSASLLIADVSKTWKNNRTRTNTSFNDINGDGYVDFIKGNSGTYYKNTANGFVATRYNNGTVSHAENENVDMEKYKRAYYAQQPLRKWKAFTGGQIEVSQNVSLINPGRVSPDGISADFYPVNQAQKLSLNLNSSRTSGSISPHTYDITSGNEIFFHMNSKEDPRGDEINWNIDIKYRKINFFEDIKYSGVIEIAEMTARRPDSPLDELYTQGTAPNPGPGNGTHTVYRLNSDWRENLTPAILDQIADKGYFKPRRIPEELFIQIYRRASDPQSLSYLGFEQIVPGEKTYLLNSFIYRPEFRDFIRVESPSGNDADSFIAGKLSSFTVDERREMFFYKDFTGADRALDISNGRNSFTSKAPLITVNPVIMNSNSGAPMGAKAIDNSIILDKVYRADNGQLSTTLKLVPDSGTYKLLKTEISGSSYIANADITEGSGKLKVSYSDSSGIEHNYELTSKTSRLESITESMYLSDELLNRVTSKYIFNYVDYDTDFASLTPIEYEDICNSTQLRTVDVDLFKTLYKQNPDPAPDGDPPVTIVSYDRRADITMDESKELTLIIDKLSDNPDSILDTPYNQPVVINSEGVGIIALTKAEYDTYILGDGTLEIFFEEFTNLSSEVYYILKANLTPQEKSILENKEKLYLRDNISFPYFTHNSGNNTYDIKPGLTSDQKNHISSVFSALGWSIYTKLSRGITYYEDVVLPVAYGDASSVPNVSNALPVGTEIISHNNPGSVTIPYFNPSGKKTFTKSYIHSYNSISDFSYKNIVSDLSEEVYKKEYTLGSRYQINEADSKDVNKVPEEFELFSGGVAGWYNGVWSGYYDFDKELIYTVRKEVPKEQDLENGEAIKPNYFESMKNNIVVVDESTGATEQKIIEVGRDYKTRLTRSTFVGPESSYSDFDFDVNGNPVTVEYKFAAVIEKDYMRADRNGGDAYFNVPRGNSPMAGGQIGTLGAGKSESDDTSGGISLAGIGANFSQNVGDSWQYQEIIDMNGDRYPDIVSFPTGKGGGTNFTVIHGNGEGFTNKATYSSQYSHLSYNKNKTFGFGASPQSTGSGSLYTLYASSGGIKMVAISSPSTDVGLGFSGLNGTVATSYRTTGFMDVNGDGLPDHLKRSGAGSYQVALNMGNNTFATPIDYGSGINTPLYSDGVPGITNVAQGLDFTSTGSLGSGGSLSKNIGIGDLGVNLGFNASSNRTMTQLMDVNGDGLVDQVLKHKSEKFFRVKFNLGDQFSSEEIKIYRPDWNGSINMNLSAAIEALLAENAEAFGNFSIPLVDGLPSMGQMPIIDNSAFSGVINPLQIDDTISYTGGASLNLGASLAIPLWQMNIIFLRFGFYLTPGVNGNYAVSTTNLTMRDINGDGLPDHVLKRNDSKLSVKVNSMGRVGLLRTIHTPQGGTINIDYKRVGNTVDMPQSRYVLSTVTKSDGFQNDQNKEGVHSYTDTYDYFNGKYDRAEREFYGFGTVEIRKADDSVQTTIYDTSSYSRRGLVLKSWLRDSNNKTYKSSDNLYGVKVVDNAGDGSSINFPYVSETIETTIDPVDNDEIEVSTLYDYDNYGNVKGMVQKGVGNDFTDDLYLTIKYKSTNGTYLKSLPSEMVVKDHRGNILRNRLGVYDSKGNLTGLKSYYSGTRFSEYSFVYDKYGNMTRVTDPLGYTKEYEYDSDVNSYVTRIFSYNNREANKKYISELTYDYRYGVELTQIDINNLVMTKEYDNFGRLRKIISPYDSGAVSAVQYEYDLTTFPWKAITRNKVSFDSSDNDSLDTYVIIDGLGRAVTTAKEGEVYSSNGNKLGWNKSGFTVFDNKARAIQTGQTVFEETIGPPTLENSPLRPTVSTYDIMDRVTSVTYPDNSVVRNSYGIEGNYNVAVVTDPLGNITKTFTDFRGNIRKIEKFDKDNNLLTQASYTYNVMGELIKVVDALGSETTFEYDLLGRQVKLQSPETGLTEFFYNSGGQLTRKIDSNLRNAGASIDYSYDLFGRLLKVDYPFMGDTVYTYGDPGASDNRAGRVVKITDQSGSTENFYGKLGEVTRVTKSVNRLTPNMAAQSAEFSYVYDYQGRMQKITYPDSEEVTYHYNSGGAVRSITSSLNSLSTTYVEDIGYDEFGQRVYIKYGNGVESTYSYDENRRWLKYTDTRNRFFTLQEINYGFDRMGNILSVSNSSSSYTLTHDYTYDGLYQLTSGSGYFEDREGGFVRSTSNYNQSVSYDMVGNILSKASSNTTSPAGNSHALNYSLNYSYYPAKPKQAKVIGNLWYLYDANGNTIEERVGGHSREAIEGTGALGQEGHVNTLDVGIGLVRNAESEDDVYSRRYFWDEENRLIGTKDPNYNISYAYDSTGMRTNKFSKDGETIYFSKMWLMTEDNPDFRQSKNIYLGETKIATRLGMANYESTQYSEVNTYYYHPDHLGSSNIVTDYKGDVFEHIEYTPYGETWIEKSDDFNNMLPFKFTGKEMDTETGLYYHGARYYNPRISRWMSSDPAGFELINPIGNDGKNKKVYHIQESQNWYSYVANNPVKYNDPTGQAIPAAVYAVCAYLSAVAASPDTVEDMRSLSENICNGDYISSGFDLVGMLVPGLTNTDEIYKGAKKLIAEYGDDIVVFARKNLADMKAPVHHLASKRAIKTGFTAKFKAIFEGAGRTLEDAWNKIPLPGHKGPHGIEHNQIILDRLEDAVSGLTKGSVEYDQALQSALEEIVPDVLPGGDLAEYIYRGSQK